MKRYWRWISYSVICIAAIAVLIQLAANRFLVQTKICDTIHAATRIDIEHLHSSTIVTDRVITDPQQIRQLIAFFNERREASRTIADEPIEHTTALFYADKTFVGAIGSGPNFFNVRCPSWSGTRKARAQELEEFNRLVGDE